MACLFSELRCKEVIDLHSGQRLGYVCDAEYEPCDGKILAIIVPGQGRAGRKMPPGPHWAKIFFFICAMAFFSRRETWAWEMWISSATSIWVLPS